MAPPPRVSTPHRPVDPRAWFPSLEEAVLERWRERDVFAESLRRRSGAPPWSFNEGPPFPNAAPGVHHVLARVFKDIFSRHRTMTGHYVERKGGWDCHGLPVELALEAELGFQSKEEIERYGIAEFNARCRERVVTHIAEFNELTERIGYWIDLDDAYRTMDPDYVESVWWALKTIHERGLLYERLKVVPYCPRDQVTLSSHELGQPGVYQEVLDPSVYVVLPSQRGRLVVWTTTPWTLVSNAAVAVDPDLIYVRTDEDYVVAEALLESVFGESVTVLERFPGRELEGTRYEPPFEFIPGEAYGPRGHTVLLGDFVTAESGTGLVHTALAFGEDDFRLGEQYGMNVVNPVRPDGTYDERIGPYAGRWVKDADAELIEDLRARGRLLRAERFRHSYPHCWRCGTPLLYYAKPSWYIATSQMKDRLLAANETIRWAPESIKHGRFGNWLENNVDWALSRERYWGTPLPVWRCQEGHVEVIGSLDELAQRSGSRLEDPHRPFVDAVSWPCESCGAEMRRVPEVIDVWFDSGSMPFAQYGAPHRNQERFESHFPVDFICEALDQTRGWFYSLLAVSTLLFDRSSYRNVVCLGLINDEQGRKMSKSLGNTVAPGEVIERFGADPLRWYFFTSKYPWDGYRFSPETVAEGIRQFLLPLWNTYHLYVLYANANGIESPASAETGEPELQELDRWMRSRLDATTATAREALEEFDATTAGRAIAELVEELSNWYVRRSRRRFWDGDPAAFHTLWTTLTTLAKLLAPFIPFLSDEIYDNLDGREPSVHLCEFPVPEPDRWRDPALEQAMATARRTVRLGLSARAQAKLRLRQPLRAAVVVAAGPERSAIESLAEIVRQELNVRELRFVSDAQELGEVEIKPNYRTLGPRFGRDMPRLAAALAELPPSRTAAAVREGRELEIRLEGIEHRLSPEDLIVSMRPLEGYLLEREGSHAVALETTLDDELRREGWAREIVHAVQAARREAALEVSDRISLSLGGDPELLEAARQHEPYIAGETLAVEVRYGTPGDPSETSPARKPSETSVDGRALSVTVVLARAAER